MPGRASPRLTAPSSLLAVTPLFRRIIGMSFKRSVTALTIGMFLCPGRSDRSIIGVGLSPPRPPHRHRHAPCHHRLFRRPTRTASDDSCTGGCHRCGALTSRVSSRTHFAEVSSDRGLPNRVRGPLRQATPPLPDARERRLLTQPAEAGWPATACDRDQRRRREPLSARLALTQAACAACAL